ncbi:MAG: UDP-N-acetylglucosamine diphosphorylase/glucosamine-1-phosphate N-acetyltransferase [Thermodesulfovibrio sp. RBG_19FT_COMBO_41_18]|jgi:bifunctional UDP-N-acetylglucosamine pyrophosphorylase/glucosamine-1-phosphate N-acetyltransferase|nr:MAG: UDP-N-acetylglucosamine diphosphorylase/glucosamine-1-phosphate N-acetyltransferase [Thermodesulfovibrio sp. RBG_19FT_COMBO_41_18]
MKLAAVVLAAGLGTRMNSSVPKVLNDLNGTLMLQHVLNTLYKLKPKRIVVVAGMHIEEIKKSIQDGSNIFFAHQKEAKGTGDALLKAVPALRGFQGTVLVVNGDTPLITPETLKKFLLLHIKRRDTLSLISFISREPDSYGRVIRDERGNVLSIIENRDATVSQKSIKEVNSGVYAIESQGMGFLKAMKLNESKGEYYLTDLVHIAKNKGVKIDAFCMGSKDEFIGINTHQELEKARQLMKDRIIRRWIDRGVSFVDTTSVFISSDVKMGKGTIVYPNVHLEGNTKVGRGCTIYPNVRIQNSTIGDSAIIKDSTLIEGSVVKNRASVGPFAHIRPGSEIGTGARIGNFVEIKKSVIGSGTKASHLTYLGDAKIGKDVNIGAGTITCNYDGYKKHITVIKDKVFIGSDSQLIAPVKIGKGAYIGAGSTIIKDVPSNALALSRVEQRHIKGWALKRKSKVQSSKFKVTKKERR